MDTKATIAQFVDKAIDCMLDKQQPDCIDSSLFEGKAGKIIACNALYNYTENEYWKEEGIALVDDVCNALGETNEMGYAYGFTGIGWCIEWLVQKGLITANTDEILEDFDDNVYKLVMFGVDKNISLHNGAIGKSAYFLKRMQAVNVETSRFKTICHHECLVLLTDEMQQNTLLMMASANDDALESIQNLIHIADTIIFFSKILILKINIANVEDALYSLVEFAFDFLEKKYNGINKNIPLTGAYEAIIKLSYACHYAGIKAGCMQWKNKGAEYLEIFAKNWQENSVVNERLGMFPILARVYYHTGNQHFLNIFANEALLLDVNNVEKKLQNGLYSVLLSAVSVLKSSTIDWDEALLYS